MGGFGRYSEEVPVLEDSNPLPIWVITGTEDAYLESCQFAESM
jgi:hypothetical protein